MKDSYPPYVFVNYLTHLKKPFEDLNELEIASINPYLINLFLAHHVDCLKAIHNFQLVYDLTPEQYYKTMLRLLPKKYLPRVTYIKASKYKYHEDLIKFVANIRENTLDDAIEYIDYVGLEELLEQLKRYNIEPKTLKSWNITN